MSQASDFSRHAGLIDCRLAIDGARKMLYYVIAYKYYILLLLLLLLLLFLFLLLLIGSCPVFYPV
jgi:hypothetical protein